MWNECDLERAAAPGHARRFSPHGGLTSTPAPRSLRSVHRLRQLVALAVLTLWLPATLHCALEAAGFEIVFVCHDHDAQDASDHHCTDDACHALEGAAFKPAANTAVLTPPALCACLLCFVAPPLAIDLTPPSGISDRIVAPPEVARTWHFVARAAPPPRAPSPVS